MEKEQESCETNRDQSVPSEQEKNRRNETKTTNESQEASQPATQAQLSWWSINPGAKDQSDMILVTQLPTLNSERTEQKATKIESQETRLFNLQPKPKIPVVLPWMDPKN